MGGGSIRVMSSASGVGSAYSASARAWAHGPERVYGPMADALVAASPVPLGGRLVLDVGAGTGVAGRAVRAEGGRVVAADLSTGMVASLDVPGVVADVTALPVRTNALGGVVAAFCLNHVDPPAAGLREMLRVTAPGGPVLASAYGSEDGHPARPAVDGALADAGYEAPGWYTAMRTGPSVALETPAGMAAEWAAAGGVRRGDDVVTVEVAFPELDAEALVAWRLGQAHTAPFVAALAPRRRAALIADAVARLGDPPVLVRRMVVLRAVA